MKICPRCGRSIGNDGCPHCVEADHASDLDRLLRQARSASEHTTRSINDLGLALAHARETRPQLEWEGPDGDGDVIVTLRGVEHWHLSAHGTTKQHALARLGEAMLMAYEDFAAAGGSPHAPQPHALLKALSQPREIIEALEFGAEHAGFDSDQIIRMWGEERMAEQIATCPNGHGPMKRVVAPLAPGAAAFESWECETCHIEKMWPDPVPTHLPHRPLVTDVTPSAVEWTFTEYGGSQGKAVVVLTKEQALHIKEYLTATKAGKP